jgi:hypothetical protein
MSLVWLSGTQLAKLNKDLQHSRRAAFATGTNKNLRVQWKSFFLFCLYFEFIPIPATLDTICLYAQFLSRSFKTTAAIKNYLSGVKLLHLYSAVSYPDFGAFELTLALRGLSRLNPHCPKQALPITPLILQSMYYFLDMNEPLDATYWCLLLFGFFLMLRKSNLTPVSFNAADIAKVLHRRDVVISGEMALVLIRWSKTNQFGQRVLKLPLVANPASLLCPIRAYRVMQGLTPAPLTSPAFVFRQQDRLVPVLYREFQVKLRVLVAKSGRDAGLYSSHSLRRGGATSAFQAGIPGELIQLHGDWSSDAYKRYLHIPLSSKLAVTNKLNKLFNSLT